MKRCSSMTAVFIALSVLAGTARADEFHVATAQELQSALTLAAENGVADTIMLAAGYYIGNFNYNSANSFDLTVRAEDGVSRNAITIDPNGLGRALTFSSSGAADITITGVTVLRNCGAAASGALRAGLVADVLVQNCRFLSPTNGYGSGIEIATARDVSIQACVVTGNGLSGRGRGVSMTGITRNVSVADTIVNSNSLASGSGVNIAGGAWVSFVGNTISGNSSGSGVGIYLRTLVRATVEITGNTITGNAGNNGVGGGVLVEANDGTVTFTGNTISGNSISGSASGEGGGVSVQGSATNSFIGNTISGNSHSGQGGGVYLYDCATASFVGNTISGNHCHSATSGGGGVLLRDSCFIVKFAGNTISGNHSSAQGGGVDIEYAASACVFSNNVLNGNEATQGGGIFSKGPTTLTANTFTLNLASTGSGGGAYLDSSVLQVANNIFAANAQMTAGLGGGLWVRPSSLLDLVNNTLTANSAVDGGGVAIMLNGVTETLHVYNNIFWNNVAAGTGGDAYLAGTGARTEFVHNNASALSGTWGVFVGNQDVAPGFADIVNRDYHLTSASPCVNAGTNNAPQLPATDADGDARIAGGRVDMGAYEFLNTDLHPADTNANWTIEAGEFVAYSDAWRNGQTWGATSNAIPQTFVTRAGYLEANGGAYHNDGAARPLRWKAGP